MTLLQFFSDNIAVISTALVSLISVIAVFCQTRMQLKRNTAEKYIEMKFTVYSDFVNSISAFETHSSQENLQNLISSCYKAMMLSHPVHAETFSNFCTVCHDFENTYQENDKDLSALKIELDEARIMMQFSLQCEMQDIDPSKHKTAKRILRRRRVRNFLNKLRTISKK